MTTESRKYLCVVGSCILLLPTGVQWFWGNMAAYVESYLHQRASTFSASDTSWITAIFLIARDISMIGSVPLFQFIGKRLTAILGVILFNVGVVSSYLAVQHSMEMLIFTLGAVSGIGNGLIYGASLELSIKWADKDRGLIISIIQSSYTFGAIIIIQFMTFYINPNNLVPDESNRFHKYFTQRDIVDSVPSTFPIFGLCFILTQLLGVCMIKERPSQSLSSLEKASSSQSSTSSDSNRNLDDSSKSDEPRLQPKDKSPDSQDTTWKRILRSKAFYVIWTTHFLSSYPYLIIVNYYKTFGQLGINDDHFLSVLGTAIVVVSAVTKVVYGFIGDRTGARLGLMLVFSLIAVSLAFMYVSLFLGRWAYFFTTILAAISSGSIYTSHTVATVQLFGSQNVALNTGLISTAGLVSMVVAPPIISVLLQSIGWMAIFMSGAGVSVICLALAAFCL